MRLSLFIMILFSGFTHAGDVDLESMTLESLLDVKTSVTSKREVSTRAAAGIVTILTQEDIKNAGARDLIDLLKTVPSVNFGYDVQGVVGLATRGFWAHEGKALLIVDGIEMNELQYGSNQFGNEFPVDQIARIEIIRGPGSVIYGGFAELSVIKITTKSASQLRGLEGSVTHGRMTRHDGANKLVPARTNTSLQGGLVLGGMNVTAGFYNGRALRGSGLYTGSDYGTPPSSGTVVIEDADSLSPRYGNIGIESDNFKFRYLFSDYQIETGTMYNYNPFQDTIPNDFLSHNIATSFAVALSPNLKITPQVNYSNQSPWRQETEEARLVSQFYHIRSQRLKTAINADLKVSDALSFLLGLEDSREQHKVVAWIDAQNNPVLFANGTDEFRMNSQAVYAQGTYSYSSNELTFGVRHERPNLTRRSTLPRLAFTHSEKYWHGKLLYSQAFRSPVLLNYETEPNIKPELTSTFETEAGYLVHKNAYLTGNYFFTQINDPIVYFNVGSGDKYSNFPRVANQGVELTYKFKPKWGQISAGYSYYQVATNKVPIYHAEGSEKALLGLPQHQVTGEVTNYLGRGRRLTTKVHYLSEKWAKTYDPAVADKREVKLDSEFLLDLIYRQDDFLIKNMGLLLAVHNVFNQKVLYPEPYDATHSPMPGPSREYRIGLDYKLSF